MQPDTLQKYHQLYLQTAQQYLASFTQNLNACVADPHHQNGIEEMFIAIHSIKSQSLVMGYAELGTFCNDVEQQLREIRTNKQALSAEFITYLQQTQQKIATELQTIQSTGKDMGQLQPSVANGMVAATGKRILLIEDDSFFENFYARKLRDAGFTVDVAANGQEGMDTMLKVKPDIILLDLVMPVKDGFQVLIEKSANPTLKPIPVVVFSTLGQESDIQNAKTLGAIDYVDKNFFDFDHLLSKIEEHISAHGNK